MQGPVSRGFVLFAAFVFAAMVMWLAPAPAGAQDRQSYQLELFITWSERTHPLDWPQDAGLSGLVGVPHTGDFSLFRDGAPASPALRQLAETGVASLFERDLETARLTGRAGDTFTSPPLETAPGYLKTRFETTLSHPYVSFAAALTPSPDWFTGASSVALRSAGEWRDSMEFAIFAWDAGSDDGETYSAENRASEPPQSVRLLAMPHMITRKGLVPVGRAVLTRLF